jgi:hypothetical protein
MAVHITTQGKGFFKELPTEKQEEYLGLKLKKFLPTIDNIYLSVFIEGDKKGEILPKLVPLIDRLLELKQQAKDGNKPVPYGYELFVTCKGLPMYDINLSDPDIYDIFVRSGKLMNEDMNRIHVQFRAFGLWTRGADEVLNNAVVKLKSIVEDYGLTISRIQENRIDFCYHTNILSDIDKVFDKKGDVRFLETPLEGGLGYFKKGKDENGFTVLGYNYYLFGSTASANWLVRLYDKVREVIEVGYKGFFFELWHDNGMISYYDKWCMEYAVPYKNFDYLHKARLAFYVEHGTDKSRIREYSAKLADSNATIADIKHIADQFMPAVTAVVNIEFQTMREFYRRSDNLINSMLKTLKQPHFDFNPLLERIYKIIDNREIFLNYLHGDGFSFRDGEKYLPWWERLRNTKVGGIKANEKLLRDYAYALDEKTVMRQSYRKSASFAAYNNLEDTTALEDIAYLVTRFSDNDIHEMDVCFADRNTGEILEDLNNSLLKDYRMEKAKISRNVKNRKKRLERKIEQETAIEEATCREIMRQAKEEDFSNAPD